MDGIARYREPGTEELAFIGLVLHRDPGRDRLQTLKAGGRLKMRTLLAAMQSGVALRTVAPEIGART